jgi:exosortase/archaeosortase family protein
VKSKRKKSKTIGENQSPRAIATWRTWYTDKAPIIRFGLLFTALMALFYGLALVSVLDRCFYAYLCGNAWVSNAILHALGQPSEVSEITIHSAQYVINVRRGCDALEPAWFFCSAVLAFPSSFVRKIPGMLIGGALILILNIIRIVSLYLIGLHRPAFFKTAHLEIWPAIFILVAILLWVQWIKWARGSENGKSKHAFT